MNGIACTAPTCFDAGNGRRPWRSRDRGSCAARPGPGCDPTRTSAAPSRRRWRKPVSTLSRLTKLSQQQAGAGDEHQRQRDFGDHERGAQAALRAIAGHGAMARRLQPGAREADRRHQARGHGDDRGQRRGKQRARRRRRAACRSTSPRAVPSSRARASRPGPAPAPPARRPTPAAAFRPAAGRPAASGWRRARSAPPAPVAAPRRAPAAGW